MNILETERLIISHITIEDANFIFELLNSPNWIKYIGNKNVHDLESAKNYILNVPIKSYEKFGFGLFLVKLKDLDIPIGICGLIKRDTLENIDIGFAFLEKYVGNGYAFESAQATLEYGKNTLGIKKIVAITNEDNYNSIKVLKKIGLVFEKMVKFENEKKELMLFGSI
ncbi:MAG: GNAT family N-acetyltransferase [Cyanobacteriota bacterium]